jgi:hypothetical protein
MMRRVLMRLFVLDHDPLASARNPQQVFLLVLSLIASLPLLGGNAGSQSLESNLPDAVVIGWGICLLIGTAMALVGVLWPRAKVYGRPQRWISLVLERSGLLLTAAAIFIYALVITTSAPDFNGVRYVVALNAAYGLFCLWRVVQITLGLYWRRRHPEAAH